MTLCNGCFITAGYEDVYRVRSTDARMGDRQLVDTSPFIYITCDDDTHKKRVLTGLFVLTTDHGGGHLFPSGVLGAEVLKHVHRLIVQHRPLAHGGQQLLVARFARRLLHGTAHASRLRSCAHGDSCTIVVSWSGGAYRSGTRINTEYFWFPVLYKVYYIACTAGDDCDVRAAADSGDGCDVHRYARPRIRGTIAVYPVTSR